MPDSTLQDRKVLLVDDDSRNLYAISKILCKKGLSVETAEDGQLALDALAKMGQVDIVIMDVMMPNMDGYTAIGEMRKMDRFKQIPVIALTAKAMADDKEKCISSGANDYLTKPVDMDELVAMIKGLLM